MRQCRAFFAKGLSMMMWLPERVRSLCRQRRWQADAARRSFEVQPVLEFIKKCRSDGYAYKYTPRQPQPVLYASVYAASLLHLQGQLDKLSPSVKQGWADYIQGYQSEDGLFRDPAVDNEIAETEDWWGWRHLSCHAIIALTALGAQAEKPFKILEFLYHDGEVEKWLASRDWQSRAASVSNEVLNYGTLLQYVRDFHKDNRAGRAMERLYDWLDECQNPGTGLWGNYPGDKLGLSLGVQTAYHLWLLYFYDRRPIRYTERCIDSCLKTQNRFGGFGVSFGSSACEDIDSIDPLVRFYHLTGYRRDDIVKALRRAHQWVLVNMNDDGGSVFVRGQSLTYGHQLMSSAADESALFPTWFRTLSLAYLNKVIDVPELRRVDWQFTECPGYQFWRE